MNYLKLFNKEEREYIYHLYRTKRGCFPDSPLKGGCEDECMFRDHLLCNMAKRIPRVK